MLWLLATSVRIHYRSDALDVAGGGRRVRRHHRLLRYHQDIRSLMRPLIYRHISLALGGIRRLLRGLFAVIQAQAHVVTELLAGTLHGISVRPLLGGIHCLVQVRLLAISGSRAHVERTVRQGHLAVDGDANVIITRIMAWCRKNVFIFVEKL